ncbi:MAG TPA: hypothetical protein VME24_02610 [Alphaproteobacteria bacterium]|nr:hypothetical protein [Alphaproteobacteria bacterium]
MRARNNGSLQGESFDDSRIMHGDHEPTGTERGCVRGKTGTSRSTPKRCGALRLVSDTAAHGDGSWRL